MKSPSLRSLLILLKAEPPPFLRLNIESPGVIQIDVGTSLSTEYNHKWK